MGQYYLDFLFSPSGFFVTSPFENPYCFYSIHFSIAFFISNKCIELRLEVQAIRFNVGWNMMLVMKALLAPLLSSYRSTPSSVLNIRIIVPLIDAVAMRVPSALTVSAPTSES